MTHSTPTQTKQHKTDTLGRAVFVTSRHVSARAYIQSPAAAAFDKTLSDKAYRLQSILFHLSYRANSNVIEISQKELGKLLGCTDQWVRKLTSELVRVGIVLEQQQAIGLAKIYTLNPSAYGGSLPATSAYVQPAEPTNAQSQEPTNEQSPRRNTTPGPRLITVKPGTTGELLQRITSTNARRTAEWEQLNGPWRCKKLTEMNQARRA